MVKKTSLIYFSHLLSFSFILTVCIYLNDQNYQYSRRDSEFDISKRRFRNDLVFLLALTYELQLDKDKEPADRRLLFRESYRSFKKRQLRFSQRVCHDYSLYMKVFIVILILIEHC